MNVSTSHTEDDGAAALSLFVFAPLFLFALLYFVGAVVFFPYARPIVPLYLIIFAILFPPLFPLLLIYVICMVYSTPVVVVERGATPSGSDRARSPRWVLVQGWHRPNVVVLPDRRDRQPTKSGRI